MRRQIFTVASSFGVLAIACAANATQAGGAPRSPQAAPEPQESLELPSIPPPSGVGEPRGRVVDPRTTEADDALDSHDYAKVLALTESPSSGQTGAWLDFDRASALTGLGRTDEAVEVFRRAELRFAQAGDDQGRSSAMWGRARALDEAGRCPEARGAYEEYAVFVRLSDPRAAQMAAAYAGACRPVVISR